MNYEYTKQIKERIMDAEYGSVFSSSDFSDIANSATVRQTLNRLVKDGMIHRVLNGIFYKPSYSVLLDEYIVPDPDMVAKAIARTYHWTIAPSGNTALNLLGLSTQVPAVWCYISDGPYRIYRIANKKLEFKHRTNKEISGLSYITILVIQALKTLGRTQLNQETIQLLSSRLSVADKNACLKEAKESTDWIYDAIRQICGGIKFQ